MLMTMVSRLDRTNMHNEERSGRSSVQTDKNVLQIDQKLYFDRRLTSSSHDDELKTVVVNCFISEAVNFMKWD